jgi:hypothetical protein
MIGFLPNVRLRDKLARFRQVNKDRQHTYHDAVEFPDGTVVLVTRLCEGQRATVLQLPVASRSTEALHDTAAELRDQNNSSIIA